VAMAAALSRGIDVWEYAPSRVKQAITGRGAAGKEQVAAMLGSILGMEYDPRRLDATDGMAVALCHHFASAAEALRGGAAGGAPPKKSKKSGSWEDFLRENPSRIKK